MAFSWVFQAHVNRVVDGDTFYAMVDHGFFVNSFQKFRLARIDTPEIFRPMNESEKKHGFAAKYRVAELILNKDVIIHTKKVGKYGRYIAEVWIDEDTNLNDLLLAEGYAKSISYEE